MNRRDFLAGLVPLAAGGLFPAAARAQAQPAQATPAAVAAHYAAMVHAAYSDTLAAAREMQAAIQRFVAAPSEAGLQAAREAWLAAREWYGLTEAFRFYGGPIDSEDGPEGRINAWPLDESYVDGVEGDPEAGIIGDPSLEITAEFLADQNERGGEENVSTGWHAIEFLLWGQDLDDDGPGARPWTDFVDGGRAHADRRRRYLEVVTGLLVDDLASLVDAWKPGATYRAEFEKAGLEAVRRIIVGIGSLSRGELAGERLEVALSTMDQEDEHSCFSDNTHRDVVANARGIEHVWQGSWPRRGGGMLRGAALRDLVAAADPALAERTSRQLAASVAAAEALQPPFDREILGDSDAPGRRRVRALVDSLVQQSKDLVDSATALGIAKLTLTQP